MLLGKAGQREGPPGEGSSSLAGGLSAFSAIMRVLPRGRVLQDLAVGTAGPSEIRGNLSDVNAHPQDEHSLWEFRDGKQILRELAVGSVCVSPRWSRPPALQSMGTHTCQAGSLWPVGPQRADSGQTERVDRLS